MNQKLRDATRFRAGDAAAVAAVVFLALGLLLGYALFSGGEANLRAEIWQNGEKLRELSLEENAELVLEGEYTNTVTVRDGRVAITHSTCPGEDCVHSGWISQAGRSIVCLPNRVEIRLTGGEPGDGVDAVAH